MEAIGVLNILILCLPWSIYKYHFDSHIFQALALLVAPEKYNIKTELLQLKAKREKVSHTLSQKCYIPPTAQL